MKCSKCSKVFDEADLNLDNRRLSARVGPPPPKHLPRQASHFGPGSGEFKPLCVGCYKGTPTVEALVDLYLGEAVVTNDRVLNDVLRHAGDIIGRRDVSPMDKFETLFAYLVKARREALGAVDI